MTTVLGSCVSVTMFNRTRKVGAICHGLMPERGEMRRSGRDNGDGFKYVDYSIRYMMDYFRSYGIGPQRSRSSCSAGRICFPRVGATKRYLSVGGKKRHGGPRHHRRRKGWRSTSGISAEHRAENCISISIRERYSSNVWERVGNYPCHECPVRGGPNREAAGFWYGVETRIRPDAEMTADVPRKALAR